MRKHFWVFILYYVMLRHKCTLSDSEKRQTDIIDPMMNAIYAEFNTH